MTRRGSLALGGLAAVVLGVLLVLLVPRTDAPPPGPATVDSSVQGCAVRTVEVPGAAASGLEIRPLCALPPEAATVSAQIRAGGPFRYDRDGVTFGNRERILPAQRSGYYREYTVPTPGEGDRGARRLVTGGRAGPAQELYYTGDHYVSFVVVDVEARS